MRLAFAAAAVFLLGIAAPTHAQGEALMPTLELGVPSLFGGTHVPVVANDTFLQVPWTYTFPAAAAVPADDTAIAWSLACPIAITWQAGPTTITFTPGQQEYSGTASFPITAAREAPGLVDTPCTVSAQVGGAADSFQASDTADVDLAVAFVGDVGALMSTPVRQAGPQKQVPYPVELTNLGNTRVLVTFDIVEAPGGRWNLLLPDPVVLDSPASGGTSQATAIVTVATPYNNGYNSGSGDFILRVRTEAVEDPAELGPSFDLPFTANVKGFYVPGPQLPLLLAVLGLAVAVRARRS